MLTLAAVLAISGCGSSTQSSSSQSATTKAAAAPVCRAAAKTIVALGVHASPAQVSTKTGTGNNGAPECRLAAPGVRVVVNVDSSPQPYARLERAIVEDGQQFGTKRTFAPPQTVGHLGLDASWVPDLNQLLTSDGHVLVTVNVNAPRIPVAARRALATALARAYLGANDPALARGPAPSG